MDPITALQIAQATIPVVNGLVAAANQLVGMLGSLEHDDASIKAHLEKLKPQVDAAAAAVAAYEVA